MCLKSGLSATFQYYANANNYYCILNEINEIISRSGDLRIIRPLVYAREHDLRAFAQGNKLPVITENCPGCFESPKV
jgi:tRNA(Ile)-lysidine synthase TilS/MesJ